MKMERNTNNELTRHGLQKIDRMRNNKVGFSKRDREIREIEDDLRERFKLEDKKNDDCFGLGSLKLKQKTKLC
jgi:hypothetical protein